MSKHRRKGIAKRAFREEFDAAADASCAWENALAGDTPELWEKVLDSIARARAALKEAEVAYQVVGWNDDEERVRARLSLLALREREALKLQAVAVPLAKDEAIAKSELELLLRTTVDESAPQAITDLNECLRRIVALRHIYRRAWHSIPRDVRNREQDLADLRDALEEARAA